MSCFYCKHYCGLKETCNRLIFIVDGSESLVCDDYEYNGEVKSNEE